MTATLVDATRRTTTTRETLEQAAAVLRSRADNHVSPSPHTVETVLSLLLRGHGPRTIQASTGLTRSDLYKLVTDLGQRYRVRGEELPENTAGVLFPIEPDEDVLETMSERRRQKVLDEAALLRHSTPVPAEWQHAAGATKSLITMVGTLRQHLDQDADVTAEALKHMLSVDKPLVGWLTFPLLAGTWKLISLGQFTRLAMSDKLTDQGAYSVLSAYEALESVRDTGVTALTRLISGDVDNLDLLTLQARPLAEAMMERFERTLTIKTRVSGREAGMTEALRTLQATPVETLPQHVGELNAGQVSRIAASLGVSTQAGARARKRRAMEQLGGGEFAGELGYLQGLWHVAEATGRTERFFEAVDLLQDGDPHWADGLQE